MAFEDGPAFVVSQHPNHFLAISDAYALTVSRSPLVDDDDPLWQPVWRALRFRSHAIGLERRMDHDEYIGGYALTRRYVWMAPPMWVELRYCRS